MAELEYNYDTAIQKQTDLQNEVRVTEVKLVRANRLINGLSGEKTRWKEGVKSLESQEGFIVGDMLFAAGSVAYMGPFMAQFRGELLDQWVVEVERLGIIHGDPYDLTSTTGEPVQIQGWGVYGLPSDPLSIENAIIMFTSSRWPLCIDPQGQVAGSMAGQGRQIPRWEMGLARHPRIIHYPPPPQLHPLPPTAAATNWAPSYLYTPRYADPRAYP